LRGKKVRGKKEINLNKKGFCKVNFILKNYSKIKQKRAKTRKQKAWTIMQNV
jgi:hypothetical protein